MSQQRGIVRIMCPNLSCKRILAVPEGARGKLVRCRSCSMTVRIPMSKGQPARAEPGTPTVHTHVDGEKGA